MADNQQTSKTGYVDWRGDRSTIAALVPREKLGNHFMGKKVAVRPGEAALFIRDGLIVKILTEGKELVSGVMDRLRGFFGAGEDVLLMMLDTGERDLRFSIGITRQMIERDNSGFYRKMARIYDSRRPKSLLRTVKDDELAAERAEILTIEQEQRSETLNDHQKENVITEIENRIDKMLKPLLGEEAGDLVLLSKDRESIVLDVKLVVNFLPDHVAETFKLMQGRESFEENDLKWMIKAEMTARVFAPQIATYSADAIRGNRDIIAGMQADAQNELMQWLKIYGMQLNRLSVNPALTEEERRAMIEKEQQALEKAMDSQIERDKHEVQRQYELTALREQLGKQIEKARRENDTEMEAVARAAFLAEHEKAFSVAEIDDKIAGIAVQRAQMQKEIEFANRRQEQELDFQQKSGNLDLQGRQQRETEELRQAGLRTESELRQADQRTEAELEIMKMQALAEEYRKNKTLKTQSRIATMIEQRATAQLDHGHVERLIEIAATSGALDSAALIETVRQASMRKALDQGDVTSQAMAQSEAQRFSRESFMAGMQSHPPLGIAGQGQMVVQTGYAGGPLLPGGGPYLTAQPPAALPQIDCSQCRRQIPPDSRFCGYCGAPLHA